jgi:hypothetical protein
MDDITILIHESIEMINDVLSDTTNIYNKDIGNYYRLLTEEMRKSEDNKREYMIEILTRLLNICITQENNYNYGYQSTNEMIYNFYKKVKLVCKKIFIFWRRGQCFAVESGPRVYTLINKIDMYV